MTRDEYRKTRIETMRQAMLPGLGRPDFTKEATAAFDAVDPIKATEDMIDRLKHAIDYRLNERLCEMEPGYDDSITGFNEAWDIMRTIFAVDRWLAG